MKKFAVRVVEHVSVEYETAEVEAEDEDEADEIAEEMRVQGHLKMIRETVHDIDVFVEPA